MPLTSSQLLKKIILILFPFLLLLFFLIAGWQYYNVKVSIENLIKEKLVGIAVTGASQIDGSLIQTITESNDYNHQNYKIIAEVIERIRDVNKLENSAIKILRRKGNVTSFVITADKRNLIGREFNLWREMNPTFNNGTVTVKMPYQKIGGEYMSVFAPIKNNSSEIVALLQIDINVESHLPVLLDYLSAPAMASILLILIGIIILKIILLPVQKTVNSLASHFNKITSGDLSAEYNDLDNGYLLEITAILNKFQTGLQKKIETGEGKEKLQRHIKELLRIVNAAANGDFTINANVTADTLGALADSFNLMVSDLGDLVKDVKKSAEHIFQFTQGITDTTASMASGAENQAKEIDQISKLSKEMAAAAGDTNNSAVRAADSAKLSKEVAERGENIVKKSIEGMHRIKDTVRGTSRRVKLLGESSVRIGEITEIISDIANRTNLLALNATIEAARAGNAGRGFAIVADEVRNLAKRSSRAASEISTLLEDIQNGTTEMIDAMEQGSQEVAHGTEMVDEAGAVLREILGAVDISTTSVEEITKATKQQLKSNEDIASVMEKIAKIAQQTAEGAKKSEIEITQLESLSKSLNNAVSKFKLSQ